MSDAAAKKGAAAAAPTSGTGAEVVLRVYDISGGMARSLSAMFLGKQLEGIWHTGVVVFGKEYFFGGGVQIMPPADVERAFGISPVRTHALGRTAMTQSVFHEYLRGISPRFTQATYDLFRHNCNNFSNEISTFLLGKGIPDYIINLPNEVLATPMGRQLQPMIQNMQDNLYGTIGASDPLSALAAGDANPYASLMGTAAATPPAVPEASATAAAAAPAPTPAPVAVEPSNVLAKPTRPLVSADVSTIDRVVNRLCKNSVIEAADQDAFRAGAAALKSKATEGGKESEEVVAMLPLLSDACARTDKNAFAALLLLRAVVLRPFCAEYYLQGDGRGTLDAVVGNLGANKYQDAAAMMALTTLANLVSVPAASGYVASEDIGLVVSAALRDVGAERPERRRMAAAVLHNLAQTVPVSLTEAGDIPESVVTLLCGLVEDVQAESDEETKRRRLVALGRLLLRSGEPAANLMGALGVRDSLSEIQESEEESMAIRALCAELAPLVGAADDEEEE